MVTVERWTGVEAKALRLAKRMSLHAFAAHLGVSERTLSTWERRGLDITIREMNQAALDTSLKVSSPDVQARFASFVGLPVDVLPESTEPAAEIEVMAQHRHPVDGKMMVLIDAGTFLAGEAGEPVWLPPFYIDVFPVTNGEYVRFVAETGHQPPDHWPRGRCPDTLFDHPVTYVTWHDARSYALWAGKELPTGQQWEKAARGTRGDTYPWGNQQTPAKCNVRESGIGSTTPVNRYHSGVSPYGVYDLCGNIWEWCSTRTEPSRYELKGGAYTSPFMRSAPHLFNDASSTMLDDDTGFRCTSRTISRG
ncbi:SUMF1/EgtB/PvdO family nonheme iron enzyme [Actinoplanes sp. NPDC051346]|uniref:SUMF1/EgtB/PvdO family nonheme iron enzyme n=1 Tax=Actinoplanes sp. NPDC051346 TaxID=3155048 RepID=UPI00342801E7